MLANINAKTNYSSNGRGDILKRNGNDALSKTKIYNKKAIEAIRKSTNLFDLLSIEDDQILKLIELHEHYDITYKDIINHIKTIYVILKAHSLSQNINTCLKYNVDILKYTKEEIYFMLGMLNQINYEQEVVENNFLYLTELKKKKFGMKTFYANIGYCLEKDELNLENILKYKYKQENFKETKITNLELIETYELKDIKKNHIIATYSLFLERELKKQKEQKSKVLKKGE